MRLCLCTLVSGKDKNKHFPIVLNYHPHHHHHLVLFITFQVQYVYPTLSLSASGTCLVSLGFGNGDPVFILNSGGTFVSSTTWMGTDSAGYKKMIQNITYLLLLCQRSLRIF